MFVRRNGCSFVGWGGAGQNAGADHLPGVANALPSHLGPLCTETASGAPSDAALIEHNSEIEYNVNFVFILQVINLSCEFY